MGVPLSPGMASRKLQVLDFYKRYRALHGGSPSQDECANALGIDKSRVKQLLKQLEREDLITRQAGVARSVDFPDKLDRISVADAMLRLREAGYGAMLGNIYPTSPNSTLPLIAELDHIPDVEFNDEGQHDTISAGDRQERRGRADRA